MGSREAVERKPSFERIVAFLSDPRVSSVSLEKKPVDPNTQFPPANNQTKEEYDKRFRILGLYFGTDATLEEIGENIGISRERVRQILHQGVRQLYEANPQVQDEFSISEFGYNKSLTVASRRRLSISKGGLSVRAEQLFLNGKKPDEIRKELNVNINAFADVRRIVKEWGTEVTYEKKPIFPRYERLKDPESADEEKQRLLDSVNIGVLRVLSSGDNPLVVAVSNVGEKAGLLFARSKAGIIYAVLRANGIPASSFSYEINKDGRKLILNYYFICATDMERAIEIIKNAQELDHFRKNPVVALSGLPDRIPRVAELKKSGNYSHVSNLITEIRGGIFSKNIGVEYMLGKGCPVPVYRHDGSIYYHLSQEEELRVYFSKRLKELGLTR